MIYRKLLTFAVAVTVAALLLATFAGVALSHPQQVQARNPSINENIGNEGMLGHMNSTYMWQMHQNLGPLHMGDKLGGCP